MSVKLLIKLLSPLQRRVSVTSHEETRRIVSPRHLPPVVAEKRTVSKSVQSSHRKQVTRTHHSPLGAARELFYQYTPGLRSPLHSCLFLCTLFRKNRIQIDEKMKMFPPSLILAAASAALASTTIRSTGPPLMAAAFVMPTSLHSRPPSLALRVGVAPPPLRRKMLPASCRNLATTVFITFSTRNSIKRCSKPIRINSLFANSLHHGVVLARVSLLNSCK